jgi:hypothetical protein
MESVFCGDSHVPLDNIQQTLEHLIKSGGTAQKMVVSQARPVCPASR